MSDQDELLHTLDTLIERSKELLADREFPDVYRPYVSTFLTSAQRLAQLLLVPSDIRAADEALYSHELRMSIGPLMGYPALILHEVATASARPLNARYLQTIEILRDLTQHMLRLINESLLPPKV
jgi:hypothetical protein